MDSDFALHTMDSDFVGCATYSLYRATPWRSTAAAGPMVNGPVPGDAVGQEGPQSVFNGLAVWMWGKSSAFWAGPYDLINGPGCF